MTDQQPHTPTTETIEGVFVTYGRIDGPLHREERRAEFYRWLTARDARIESAAEQRGAERALVDAAKTLREVSPESATPLKNMPGNVPVYIWLAHRAEKYRADQIEGDDE